MEITSVWSSLVMAYVLIFVARVADVSLDVVRVLLLMRGRRMFAALIGFVEVSIFIVAISEVIKNGVDDIFKVLAYAGGFATGNIVGSLIEEKMALGYVSLQVFPHYSLVNVLTDKFREEGFGVTTITGEGRKGPRPVMFVTLERRDMNKAMDIMDKEGPRTFFCVSDARSIHGGIFPRRKGN